MATGKKGISGGDTREEERVFWGGGVGGEEMGGIPGMEGPVPALSILDLDGCSWCSVVLCAVKMV